MAPVKTTVFDRNPIRFLIRSLSRDLVGAYRPERHYMRGPGPKWHEKHAPRQSLDIVDLRSTKPAT